MVGTKQCFSEVYPSQDHYIVTDESQEGSLFLQTFQRL